MLRIRPEQMRALQQAAVPIFEDELVAHASKFSPALAQVLGRERLRAAVVGTIARARAHGFTYRGPIRLYLELALLYGSDFVDDPQYVPFAQFLAADDDQMVRAEQMHAEHADYVERVCGADNELMSRAVEAMLDFVRAPMLLTADDPTALMAAMRGVYPAKAAYVGDDGLRALAVEAHAQVRTYGLEARLGVPVMLGLMISFGHGCSRDPFYPWIGHTLDDRNIVDAQARAERLQKRFVTWLEHVVARIREGA